MSERNTLTLRHASHDAKTTPVTDDDVQPQTDRSNDQAWAAMRHEMIATEAYLRAAERGFEPRQELDDWLAAETIVDARLKLLTDSEK